MVDAVLAAGDGAGVAAELSVSLTAQTDGEILLIDLGRHENGQP